MIYRFYAAVLAAVLLLPSVTGAADRYALDPRHASFIFSVSHNGFSYTFGMFKQASGLYEIDPQDPSKNHFRIVIKTDSLDTNDPERDKHLRSGDFFNVQQFPEIVFDSTSCTQVKTEDGGVVYQVSGMLSMHGIQRPITINLRQLGSGKGPYGDMRTGFMCSMELKRSDFNMTGLLDKGLVGDAVGITISFEGIQQAGAAGAR